MIKNEKVAILLSSYNGERYIQDQVVSILEQKIDCDLTLYVRDDGSTDSTVQILRRIEESDSRLVIITGNNCGATNSFFELLRMASGLPMEYTYFALSDQDDVWDSDKIQIGINAIRQLGNTYPILYGSITRPVNENLEVIPRKRSTLKPITFYNSIIQTFIAGHTQVMNRQLLDLVYNADSSYIYGYDSFILNVAVLSGEVVFDNVAHASYRQHENNQLGTSNYNRISWIKQRLNRIQKGDAVKYGTQIEYICEYCKKLMSQEQYDEITRFLECRKSFFKRIGYIVTKRLYRQELFEDIAFCLLYLFGGYNTNVKK